MNRKRTAVLTLLAFLLLGVGSAAAQTTQGINETFGGADTDEGFSVVQTDDGGFAVAGLTESFGSGSSDAFLVKTDANGNEEFSRTFGGADSDRTWSVVQTDDGGFALAGFTFSFGSSGGSNGWLIKTDANGNEEFNVTFTNRVRSVVQTNDGGYALAGRTANDGLLIKTDANGNEEFSRTFGGADGDAARAVVQTSDGGYALAGEVGSFDAKGARDFWLIKTNSSGNEEFNRTFGGGDADQANSLVQTSDGGYALAGQTPSFGSGFINAWLIKTDSNGNEQVNETYADSGRARSVVQTDDGGYALGARTNSFGSFDAFLIKTDANGNEEFSEAFGGGGFDEGYSVVQKDSGGYALAGVTESFGSGNEDMWLLEVSNTNITSQTDIDVSGGYRITKNITDVNVSSFVNITTSDVSLDGMGNTVDGTDDSGSTAINISSSGPITNVTVKNLTVKDWGDGIRYDNTDNGKLIDVNATSNLNGVSLSSSDSNEITGSSLSSNIQSGLSLDSSVDNNIVNNDINSNVGDGLSLRSSADNEVINNKVNSNVGDGLSLAASSDSNKIIDNELSSNLNGISLNSSVDNNVSENNASSNDENGISLAASGNNNQILNNELNSNVQNGLRLSSSDDNNVSGNDASSNDEDGISIDASSNNNIINNGLSSNVNGISLDTSDDNNVSENNASSNDEDGISIDASSSNEVTKNLLSSNVQAGLGLNTSDDNEAKDNDANSNGEDGIGVSNSDNNLIESNSISDNNVGISLSSSSEDNQLRTNDVTQSDGTGVDIDTSNANEIEGNKVMENAGSGVSLSSSDGNQLTNNEVTENNQGTGGDASTGGIALQNSVSNTLIDNTASQNNNQDFVSTDNSIGNTVVGLSINPTITFNKSKDVTITSVDSPPADPEGRQNVNQYLNVTGTSADSFIFLNVSYDDSDASSIDESSLRIWKNNGSWSQVPGVNGVNTNKNEVFANITSFSVIAPLGEEEAAGECIDRRSLSRGEEDEECPTDRGLSRGESREELDHGTGRDGDTARRNRGRDSKRRGRGR